MVRNQMADEEQMARQRALLEPSNPKLREISSNTTNQEKTTTSADHLDKKMPATKALLEEGDEDKKNSATYTDHAMDTASKPYLVAHKIGTSSVEVRIQETPLY